MTSSATIPGYTILKPLGQGQMAHVFLATDGKGRQVALKIPKPETLQNPTLARMFANEIALSRGLEHPRIVHCFEGVPTGVGAYLAMKYVQGNPLNQLNPSPDVVMRVLADVAAALEYLHARKIVHQDVKPGNIFVAQSRGFLADFGAAINETSSSGDPAGSPFYMSPELYQGERGTSKSDVYSFGIMAYEQLTLMRPIVGETFEQLQVAHLARVPAPVRSMNPEIGKPLAGLIDRAVAKNPMHRPTMQDFRAMLESLISPDAEAVMAEVKGPTPMSVGREKVTEPVHRRVEANAMRAKEAPQGFLGRLFKKR